MTFTGSFQITWFYDIHTFLPYLPLLPPSHIAPLQPGTPFSNDLWDSTIDSNTSLTMLLWMAWGKGIWLKHSMYLWHKWSNTYSHINPEVLKYTRSWFWLILKYPKVWLKKKRQIMQSGLHTIFFFFLNATFICFDFHKVIFIQFIKYVLHIKLWKIWNVMEQSQIFPCLA